MGLPLLSCSTTRVTLSSSSSSWCSRGSGGFRSSNCSSKLFDSPASSRSDLKKRNGKSNSRLNGLSLEKLKSVKASSSSAGQSSGEVIDDGDAAARGLAVTSGDVTSVGSFSSGEFVGAGSGGLAGPSGEVTSVGKFVGGSGGDFKAWDNDAVIRLSYGIGKMFEQFRKRSFLYEISKLKLYQNSKLNLNNEFEI